MKATKAIQALTIIGNGVGNYEIVGAIDPEPTATVIAIIVTDPTLVGGTRSSIINIEILSQPPSIPTSKNTAKYVCMP